MSEFFLQIINMSISASYIVLAVLLLRPLLRRAPKWINGILWGIVAVRLICPFSVESMLSLIPSAEVVSPDIMMDQTPSINSGIPIVNAVVNPMIGSSFAPDPTTSANPLQLWIPMLALIWLVGVLALLVYMTVSYLRLSRRVGDAVRLRENIYQSGAIASPFVLGLIKPRIYLPLGLSERDTEHVLAHERAHIRRRDYLWKPLGFLLLALHWFNPLMWLGYVLLCRDIELACDQKVIRSLGRDARADYSQALLGCSVKRHTIAACPLAFGEVGVKTRVKSVLNYKKPAFWIIVAALIVCIAVAVCFLTNPKNERQDDGDTPPFSDGPRYGETDPARLNEVQRELLEKYPHFFGLDAAKGLDVYVCQFAPTNYNFSLAPHSEDETVDSVEKSIELTKLGSVRLSEMREILATYEINRDDVTVVPWQAMHSSYIAPYFIYPIRPSDEKELIQQRYIDGIMEMLFGENKLDGTDEPTAPQYGETDPARLNEAQKTLLETHPQFFGLDASGGLDVYVHQMAPEHYCFALAVHSDVDGTVDPQTLGGCYTREMREILATYEIDPEDITVIPWQSMYSSYMGPYFCYPLNEKERTQQRYIDGIIDMLFDEKT